MPVNIGNLNRRVQVQQPVTAADNYGQQSTTYQTVYTCWAAIEVFNSALKNSPAEFTEKATYHVTIRFPRSPVFSKGDRLVYTSPTTNTTQIFEIESVLNPGMTNIWLQFLCYTLDAEQ